MNSYLRAHKPWFVSLLLSVAIGVATLHGAKHLNANFSARERELSRDIDLLEQRVSQQNSDGVLASELLGVLNDDQVDKILEPFDRQITLTRLASIANTHHLSSFRHMLSEPKAWSGGAAFAGIQGIVIRKLELTGEAPTDMDVYRMIEAFTELPGRIEVTNLSIDRMSPTAPHAQSFSVRNVRFLLAADWYTNDSKMDFK